jgi:predicted nuclease of predicted toxin-antitoxin system
MSLASSSSVCVHGLDILSVREAKPGVSDEDVLAAAGSEGRIILTEDRDFGELVVRQQLKVGGIILLELDRLCNEAEADLVVATVTTHFEKLSGNLLVIEPGRVRIRPLR